MEIERLYEATRAALSSAKRFRVLTYGDDVDRLLLTLFDAVGASLESDPRRTEQDS